MAIEDDQLVVRLSGWRSVWAMSRGIRVPVVAIIAADHDPGVYSRVPTKARMIAKQRSGLIKLGASHSMEGWTFWACGLGRNAVVVETKDYRYGTIVVEVENPVATVRSVREAAGLPILGSTSTRPAAPRGSGGRGGLGRRAFGTRQPGGGGTGPAP